MAHGTQLNSGTGGDVAATYDLVTGGAAPTTGKTGSSVLYVAATSSGNAAAVNGNNPLYVSAGGTAYSAVAAGVGTAAVVVKASAGRMAKIIVVATGTAAISIYDNASAASGTILFTIPASAATGTVYDLQIPATAGITAGQVNNSPALNVLYF